MGILGGGSRCSHDDEPKPKAVTAFPVLSQPELPPKENFDIWQLAQRGYSEQLIGIIEKGEQHVNDRDKENITVLHWAAINNRLPIVEYVICYPHIRLLFSFLIVHLR